MIEYIYSTTHTSPNLDNINTELATSTMINKSLKYMTWKQRDEKLYCYFDFELDLHDKPLFDAILAQNL